ncbi:MAG: UvrD-helicase domain-containing protein, partial [Patescibacteria group bacterium]
MPPHLNPEQERAVRAPIHEPLLIIAGAGTGKTRTLTERIAHIIKEGVPAEQICALTFTNKAAKEMVSRVEALIGHDFSASPLMGGGRDIFGAPGPFVGTFHSFGARILRREAGRLGREANFAIFDDTDSFQLLKRVLKGFAEEIGRGEGPGAFADRITKIKNGVAKKEAADDLTRRVFERYEAALAENNAFDFDDLIDKVVNLFRAHPDRLAWYGNRFTHILVDEYQDVNNRQYDLVRFLVCLVFYQAGIQTVITLAAI